MRFCIFGAAALALACGGASGGEFSKGSGGSASASGGASELGGAATSMGGLEGVPSSGGVLSSATGGTANSQGGAETTASGGAALGGSVGMGGAQLSGGAPSMGSGGSAGGTLGGASTASGGAAGSAAGGSSTGGKPAANGGSAGAPAVACPGEWKQFTVQPGHCLYAGDKTWVGDFICYRTTLSTCKPTCENEVSVTVSSFDQTLTLWLAPNPDVAGAKDAFTVHEALATEYCGASPSLEN